MLRKVLGVLLLGVLSACTQPDGRCSSSVECPTGGACSNGFCSVAGEAPAGTCDPVCSAFEACSADTQKCVSRYSDLTLSPKNLTLLGKGPHTIEATLRVVTGFEAVYPETLNFTVTKTGGTPQDLPPATRNEGVYTTQWNPSEDGDYQLRVSAPELGALSGTVQLSVDVTGPVFTVSVPTPVLAVSDGGTTYGDPTSPNAWRRDQEVAVQVRTNEQHLNPSTVKVALNGTDGSSKVTDVSAYTADCDAGFCGRATLKLWEPAFNQFRGSMPIEVRGSDTLNNVGTSAAAVSVTRWKWTFDAKPGSIRSTPAVGQSGAIYFGTTSGSEGKVVALRPDGNLQWLKPLGAVEGGVAVGANVAETELVYVGVKTSTRTSLYSLIGATGESARQCPGSGSSDTYGAGVLFGAIGVGPVGGDSAETAVSVYNGVGTGSAVNKVVGVDSKGGCYSFNPLSGESISAIVRDGSIAINGTDFFYPSTNAAGSRIASYTFGSTSQRLNWPVNLSYTPRGLALAETNVIASAGNTDSPAAGGIYRIPQSGGASSATLLFPTAATAKIYGVAVSADAAFFGAQTATDNSLNNLPLSGGSPVSIGGFEESILVAPVVGRNSIYFVSTTGTVEARAKDTLTERWRLVDGSLGTVDSSPTVDCSRDVNGSAIAGMPGVLYVTAGGKVHAFVVDSAGLDPDAKWPKYQHDVRNTGNPATPITACP